MPIFRGTVATTSRPTIAPNWRLAPNLAAQVNVVDVVLPVGGLKLSMASEVKPVLDSAGARADQRFGSKPARQSVHRKCGAQRMDQIVPVHLRSAAAGQNMPNLWLEIRPIRAIAAQPVIGANAVTLLVGVQAQTRIVPNETQPVCPFPQQLDLVPQANQGSVDIAVPIDIPFPEVSRLLETQFAGKTFPEDGSGSFGVTIKQAAIAASSDRLLISLLVNVKKRGFFSIGADATVHVWGRPVLDQDHQTLRFTDVALDVQSNAAFGLLGAAAEAATPYLQKTLAERAVVDLKPFATDARSVSRRRSATWRRKLPGCVPRLPSTIFASWASPMTTKRCALSPTPKAMSVWRSHHWRCSRSRAPEK